MIDKLTLNNEIVLMRKVVRQARVHVIAKLVREIRKLRASKGDDAVKAKNNRKAERKVEVLMVLKKLKPDDVSKFALKNTEDAAEKIANPNTEIEERALFKLICSKVLAERVNEFRSKYPDWKDFINEMLDEIGANRKKNSEKPNEKIKKTNPGRTEKVKSSANKCNGIKKSPANALEKSYVGSDPAKVTVPEVDRKSKFNAGWTIEDVEPVQKVVSVKKVKESVKREEESKKRKRTLPANDQSLSNRSSWSVSENKKKKGAAEIRKFSELVSEDDEFPVEEETPGEKEVETQDEVTVKEEAVDPFFMTSDGTAEYRTNIKAVDNNDDEDVPSWRKEMKPFSVDWGGSKGSSFNGRGHPSRGRGFSGRGRDQFGRGRGQFGRGASQQGRGAGQFGRGGGQFGRGGQFSRERGSNRGQGFGSRGKVFNDNTKFKQSPGLPSAYNIEKEQSLLCSVLQRDGINISPNEDGQQRETERLKQHETLQAISSSSVDTCATSSFDVPRASLKDEINERGHPQLYLLQHITETKQPEDDVDLFMRSIAVSMKKLPPLLINKAKMDILSCVSTLSDCHSQSVFTPKTTKIRLSSSSSLPTSLRTKSQPLESSSVGA